MAARVRYVGSPEHKSHPSFAGPPVLRSDASRCDPHLDDPEELTSWLRSAIREGKAGDWQHALPRYVWYRDGEQCYEARLTNVEQAHYKGYPDSCPEWLAEP